MNSIGTITHIRIEHRTILHAAGRLKARGEKGIPAKMLKIISW